MGEYDITQDKLLAGLPVFEGQVKIGDCLLSEKIGEGGMGSVYLGKHVKLKVPVAVKVLPFHLATKNPRLIARFKREAQTAARLDHQNLIRVYAVDEDEGVSYLVMEFIDGEDIEGRLEREGPLPEADALGIAIAAGEALCAAHAESIVHRDVKPANIMVRHKDGRVKVTDLGLAKSFQTEEGEAATGLTATGQVLGTPAFMSPEQARSEDDIDGRTDIYSLGATLFTMLTSRHVHEETKIMKLMMKVANDPAPGVKEVRPEVSDMTASVLARMLAKDCGERFQTMEETVSSLKNVRKVLELTGVPSLARPGMAGKNPILAGFTLEDITPEIISGGRRKREEEVPSAAAEAVHVPETKKTVAAAPSRMWVPVLVVILVAAGGATAWWFTREALRREKVGRAETLVSKARILLAEGKPQEAQQELYSALDLVPQVRGAQSLQPQIDKALKVQALLRSAGAYVESRAWENARQNLFQAVALAPQDGTVKSALAQLDEKEAAWREEREHKAEFKKWMDEGRRLKLLGKDEQAARVFDEAARFAAPGDDEAAREALAARVRPSLKAAVEAFDSAEWDVLDDHIRSAAALLVSPDLKRGPADDWIARGRRAQEDQNFVSAVEAFTAAAKLEEKHPENPARLASAARAEPYLRNMKSEFEVRNWQQLEAQTAQARSRMEDYPVLLRKAADEWIENGKAAAADKDFETGAIAFGAAEALDSDNPAGPAALAAQAWSDHHTRLAAEALDQGLTGAAREEAEEALRHAPNAGAEAVTEAAQGLDDATAALEKEDFERAVAAGQASLAAHPSAPVREVLRKAQAGVAATGLLAQARTAYEEGRFQDSVDLCRKSLQTYPTDGARSLLDQKASKAVLAAEALEAAHKQFDARMYEDAVQKAKESLSLRRTEEAAAMMEQARNALDLENACKRFDEQWKQAERVEAKEAFAEAAGLFEKAARTAEEAKLPAERMAGRDGRTRASEAREKGRKKRISDALGRARGYTALERFEDAASELQIASGLLEAQDSALKSRVESVDDYYRRRRRWYLTKKFFKGHNGGFLRTGVEVSEVRTFNVSNSGGRTVECQWVSIMPYHLEFGHQHSPLTKGLCSRVGVGLHCFLPGFERFRNRYIGVGVESELFVELGGGTRHDTLAVHVGWNSAGFEEGSDSADPNGAVLRGFHVNGVRWGIVYTHSRGSYGAKDRLDFMIGYFMTSFPDMPVRYENPTTSVYVDSTANVLLPSISVSFGTSF